MYDSDGESEYGISRRRERNNQNYHRPPVRNDGKLRAVVISIRNSHCVLEHENINGSVYYILNQRSTNVDGSEFPRMREFVEILDSEPTNSTGESSLKNPGNLITRFSYKPPELKILKKEIFAVAEVRSHFLIVAGGSFRPFAYLCIPGPMNFTPGQLILGDVVELPPCVAVKHNNDEAFFVKDLVYERKFHRRKVEALHTVIYAENVRALTEEEEQHVLKRCADFGEEELTLEEAKLYIQDPHVAVGFLQEYYEYLEAEKHRVVVRHEKIGNFDKGPTLQFYLDESDYKRCFQSKSTAAWKRGMELQIAHSKLRWGGQNHIAILSIRSIRTIRNLHLIELVAVNSSRTELHAAFKFYQDFIEEPFVICPVYEENQALLETIMGDFDDFFGRELFSFYKGSNENKYVGEVPNREEPFYVSGKPLDSSQLEFMRCAAAIPGFTCAQAPPGCGKTHSTAALVAHLQELDALAEEYEGMDDIGGVCISGTTNAAVTNACDAVNRGFPDIKVVRDYSRKAVADVTKESEKTSLNHMAMNPGQYVDLNKHEQVNDVLQDFNHAKKALDKQAPNLRRQMGNVAAVKTQEIKLKKSFRAAYGPTIFGTTVEKLIRTGDIFAQGDGDQKKASALGLRRLILDEAAAMSPIEALALYCKFPSLTHITLLGDMKQLGPYSTLPEESLAKKLVAEGELTRLFRLKSTTTRDLNTIYRCHPKITEKFLIPIYGEQMKAGVTAEARNLALEKKLPVAKDGSPCLLVNVDGASDGAMNHTEFRITKAIVSDLQRKGVSMDDVVILCHHNAQKGLLVDFYAEKGTHGELKTLMPIHTVDSFQGKEAKVIILLTTKTCIGGEAGDALHRLGFVSNPSRGTVAVSRAQHVLYILGNWLSLARTPFWQKFIPAMIEAGGVVDDGYDPCDEVISKLRRVLRLKRVVQKREPAVEAEPSPEKVTEPEPSSPTEAPSTASETAETPSPEKIVYEVCDMLEEFKVASPSMTPKENLISFD